MARSKKAQAATDSALETPMPTDQVGLGVDIVSIERMRKILKRTPSFSRRVFSEAERVYCDAKAQPEVHYATRFAAKEAVVKALGTGFSEGIGVRDIEVRRTSKGRPVRGAHRPRSSGGARSGRQRDPHLAFLHAHRRRRLRDGHHRRLPRRCEKARRPDGGARTSVQGCAGDARRPSRAVDAIAREPLRAVRRCGFRRSRGGRSVRMRIERRRKRASRRGCGRRRRRAVRDAGRIAFRGRADDVPVVLIRLGV